LTENLQFNSFETPLLYRKEIFLIPNAAFIQMKNIIGLHSVNLVYMYFKTKKEKLLSTFNHRIKINFGITLPYNPTRNGFTDLYSSSLCN